MQLLQRLRFFEYCIDGSTHQRKAYGFVQALQRQLTTEIVQHELSHPIVGMIQMNQLSDERFNQLIAVDRIYAMDAKLFVKDQECQVPSLQVSRTELID